MRFAAACLAFVTIVTPAFAQEDRAPSSAAALPQGGATSVLAARPEFHMTPDAERNMRAMQAKMDAADAKMTANGRRLMRSICSACDAPPTPHHRSKAIRSARSKPLAHEDDPSLFDSEQTPID